MDTQFKDICMLALETRNTLTMNAIRNVLALKQPEWFIEEIGSFFFDKREEIARGDLNYFLTYDYCEQKKKWGFLGPLAALLIDELRATVLAIDKNTLEKLSKKLLGLYCSYKLVKQ